MKCINDKCDRGLWTKEGCLFPGDDYCPDFIPESEQSASSPVDSQSAGCVPLKIAEELCIWVESCLGCKDWIWDGQQREAAEFAVKQFQQFKEQNAGDEAEERSMK